MVSALNSNRAVRWVAHLVCSLGSSLLSYTHGMSGEKTCQLSSSHAHRSDNLRLYALQVLAWYARMDVFLRVGVFPHLPIGFACELPFLTAGFSPATLHLRTRQPNLDVSGFSLAGLLPCL